MINIRELICEASNSVGATCKRYVGERKKKIKIRKEGWGVVVVGGVGAAELMDNVLCNYILSV